jgi:hypothetical protein
MIGPTPRQQAGYLRRLLRRGEIEVADPRTGRALPVIVELCGEVIRLVPVPQDEGASEISQDALRWAGVLARLRRALSLDAAEELAEAVEAEAGAGAKGGGAAS